MNEYIYINHNTKEEKTIFALDILKADKLYEQFTGIDPRKISWLSVKINFHE